MKTHNSVLKSNKRWALDPDAWARRVEATAKLTKRQLAEIEAGTANPTLATLQRIGRLFGFGVGFVAAPTDA